MKDKFKKILSNFFIYKDKKPYEFTLTNLDSINNTDETSNETNDIKKVFPSLNVNLDYIKVKYNTLINSDIVIREFTLIARDKQYNAFLVYIDGMVDSKLINDFVLKPLMLRNDANTYNPSENKSTISKTIANNITVKKVKKFNLEDFIYNSLVPQNSITKENEFEKIITDINYGNCALFVDTLGTCFDIEVKGFKQRSISAPNNEIVIRGSQEAFVEVIRVNTSIIRRLVNNENLIIEDLEVGKISRTKVAVCYLKNIANDDLVAEVKFRINNLDIDSLISSGQLEQLIQDTPNSIFPQLLSTERPDKAASHLFEGRVVVLVNGTPYCLIMPAVLSDFISSPEDKNLKHKYSTFTKFIRLIAVFFALFLPGFYVAITGYHQEIIPTELLFAIVASRQSVPFPIIFEILIMEFSFELIREAGLRVPSPIGPTLGIVGALILGQAAVSANIVSPILIIIVSITSISSFAIPDLSFNFSIRILRFLFIFLGYALGFLGIAVRNLCLYSNTFKFKFIWSNISFSLCTNI